MNKALNETLASLPDDTTVYVGGSPVPLPALLRQGRPGSDTRTR